MMQLELGYAKSCVSLFNFKVKRPFELVGASLSRNRTSFTFFDDKRFIFRTLIHVPIKPMRHGLGRTRRESADCNSRERLGRGLG